MDNLKTLIVAILLLSATFFITQSVFAADKSMSATNATLAASPNVKEFVSFVESAAAYAKENGKDKAFKEFDNKKGQSSNGIFISMPLTLMRLHLHMENFPTG